MTSCQLLNITFRPVELAASILSSTSKLAGLGLHLEDGSSRFLRKGVVSLKTYKKR